MNIWKTKEPSLEVQAEAIQRVRRRLSSNKSQESDEDCMRFLKGLKDKGIHHHLCLNGRYKK